MAGYLVDPSIGEALVLGLLAGHLWRPQTADTAGGLMPPVLMPGDEDPAEDVLTRWVRLVRVDVEPRDRVIGDSHTDAADLVAVFNIECRPAAMAASSSAVNQTGQVIAKALTFKHATHAATGHDLQLRRAVVKCDPPEDALQKERSGVITVTGLLQRVGGTDAADSVQVTSGIDG